MVMFPTAAYSGYYQL